VSLSEAKLLDDIRQRLFSPVTSNTPRAVGVEIELIPIHALTRLPALPRTNGTPSTSSILSRLGGSEGWREQSVENDPPSWKLPDGTSISFEPGGQIEISSAPHATASSAIEATRALAEKIQENMTAADIDLLPFGVDPYNGIDAVPLQLHRDRYARMTRYFDSIGPSGIRMMRQTAAIQINLERGQEPRKRWTLLNAVAPYLVALFANSRNYAGNPTEHASFRAHLWRTLDNSRTGLPCDATEPAVRYFAFALDAKAMRSSDGEKPWLTFREWMRVASLTEEDWLFHLSTLFPEVRPKEFFEIRSADAIDSGRIAAPVVFATGIVYDDESAAAATKLLGAPSERLLERAGQFGMNDPRIAKVLPRLIEIAFKGAERLGTEYIVESHLAIAREYFAGVLAANDI
jgi:glutamate--cysteine ligase